MYLVKRESHNAGSNDATGFVHDALVFESKDLIRHFLENELGAKNVIYEEAYGRQMFRVISLGYDFVLMEVKTYKPIKFLKREPETNQDVHTEHCCLFHGCKYSDKNGCTVLSKEKVQSFPCEDCCNECD